MLLNSVKHDNPDFIEPQILPSLNMVCFIFAK